MKMVRVEDEHKIKINISWDINKCELYLNLEDTNEKEELDKGYKFFESLIETGHFDRRTEKDSLFYNQCYRNEEGICPFYKIGDLIREVNNNALRNGFDIKFIDSNYYF